MRHDRHLRSVAGEAGKHFFLLFVLALALFPLYMMLTAGGKTNAQFAANPWTLLSPFHWENHAAAWKMVAPYLFNSIFVCVTSVVLTLFLSLNAAYFFARCRLPGARTLWGLFLAMMLMPGTANLVTMFTTLRELGLLNTLWALVTVNVALAQAVQIYILRNFIADLPRDLFDAAAVDGASHWQQIYHLVLPMSGNILPTLGILQFIYLWSDYILPSVAIRDDRLLTVAVGLVRMDAEPLREWGPLMSGYALAGAPMIVVLLLTMRLFMKGLASAVRH